MKMDALRFVNADKHIDLPLLGSGTPGPFVLKGAEGLGPTDVAVRIAQTIFEVGQFQGKNPTLRQAVIMIGLEPDWTIGQTPEQLREELYALLNPPFGYQLILEIMYKGVPQGWASGHISRLETATFTKDPAVQITMDFISPYFAAPSMVQYEPTQRMQGEIRAFDVDNPGTAPTGFRMGVILRANVGKTLHLYEGTPFARRITIEGINWVAGDRFVVDTRGGSRNVYRGAAGGSLVSVLNNMDMMNSTWLTLSHGVNPFMINTKTFDWDPSVKFQFHPAYLGV